MFNNVYEYIFKKKLIYSDIYKDRHKLCTPVVMECAGRADKTRTEKSLLLSGGDISRLKSLMITFVLCYWGEGEEGTGNRANSWLPAGDELFGQQDLASGNYPK